MVAYRGWMDVDLLLGLNFPYLTFRFCEKYVLIFIVYFSGPSQRRLVSEPWASPNLAGLNGSQPRSLGQRSVSESISRYLELGSKQVGAEASSELLPEPINWRVQEAAVSVDDASLRDNTLGSDRKVFVCR